MCEQAAMSYVRNITKRSATISGGAGDWTRVPDRASAGRAPSMPRPRSGLKKENQIMSNNGQNLALTQRSAGIYNRCLPVLWGTPIDTTIFPGEIR